MSDGSASASPDGAAPFECEVEADQPPREAELHISIVSGAWVTWLGSVAQLRAEGLLAHDFVLPEGKELKKWKCDGYTYSFWRRQPADAKGPKTVTETTAERWFLERKVTGEQKPWEAASVHMAREAYERALLEWHPTRAYRVQKRRYWEARKDQRFQKAIAAMMKPL